MCAYPMKVVYLEEQAPWMQEIKKRNGAISMKNTARKSSLCLLIRGVKSYILSTRLVSTLTKKFTRKRD